MAIGLKRRDRGHRMAADAVSALRDRLRKLGDDEVRYEVLRVRTAATERACDQAGHGTRVGELSGRIAAAMGLPDTAIRTIAAAAAIHDIGKVAVPRELLTKHDELDPDELEVIRLHTTVGADLLSGGGIGSVLLVAEAVARAHHEHWDGTGYHGLRGDRIHLAARIVAVADVYDALVNSRSYKSAWSPSDAMAEIVRGSGSRFDPAVVEAFLVAARGEISLLATA